MWCTKAAILCSCALVNDRVFLKLPVLYDWGFMCHDLESSYITRPNNDYIIKTWTWQIRLISDISGHHTSEIRLDRS